MQPYLFFQTLDDGQQQVLLHPQLQRGEDNVHVVTKLLPPGDEDRTVSSQGGDGLLPPPGNSLI